MSLRARRFCRSAVEVVRSFARTALVVTSAGAPRLVDALSEALTRGDGLGLDMFVGGGGVVSTSSLPGD